MLVLMLFTFGDFVATHKYAHQQYTGQPVTRVDQIIVRFLCNLSPVSGILYGCSTENLTCTEDITSLKPNSSHNPKPKS